MPEYLAPGVYVEEIDTGSKPIEGVSTSTSGMVGITERGPVNETTLVTGFADYRRQFGGFLNRRVFTGANWLFPHSVDGFFTNGGKRLYVVRVLPDAATYATMQLFGAVSAGLLEHARAARAGPASSFLIVDDPTNLAAGDWLLVDDGLRTEYLEASDADVLVLRAALAAGAPAGDAVTPYTFAPTGGGASTPADERDGRRRRPDAARRARRPDSRAAGTFFGSAPATRSSTSSRRRPTRPTTRCRSRWRRRSRSTTRRRTPSSRWTRRRRPARSWPRPPGQGPG